MCKQVIGKLIGSSWVYRRNQMENFKKALSKNNKKITFLQVLTGKSNKGKTFLTETARFRSKMAKLGAK